MMKRPILAVLGATTLLLPLQACSTMDEMSSSNKTVNPAKVATIELYDPDLDDTRMVTLIASNHGDCQEAIRFINAQAFEEAKEKLTAHVENKESDINAWYALGALYEHKQDYPNALRSYQQAVIFDKKGNNEYRDAVQRLVVMVDN